MLPDVSRSETLKKPFCPKRKGEAVIPWAASRTLTYIGYANTVVPLRLSKLVTLDRLTAVLAVVMMEARLAV